MTGRAMTYALSNGWDQEEDRLGLLETVLDPYTFGRLSSLPIRPGWRILEVGAGHGSVTRWLCDQIGPRGALLATDIDTRFLDRIDHPALTVRRHDVRVDELPERQYDLVFTRALLAHLPDRDDVIHRLAGTLAPGGWLVVEDLDYCTVGLTGPPEYVRTMERMADTLRARSGTSYEWPRRLAETFAFAGLEETRVEGHLLFFPGRSPAAELLRLSWLETLGDPEAPTGVTDGPTYRSAVAALRDPDCWASFPAFIGAAGRRPTAS